MNESILQLRDSLPETPSKDVCIGCGTCCKEVPCGAGYDTADQDGNKTCRYLVEVDRIDGNPQYRCRIFEQLNKDEFTRMCLEPGLGCDRGIATIIGSEPTRLSLLQALQRRAGIKEDQLLIKGGKHGIS